MGFQRFGFYVVTAAHPACDRNTAAPSGLWSPNRKFMGTLIRRNCCPRHSGNVRDMTVKALFFSIRLGIGRPVNQL